ncbi:hypothetical protein B0J13DRAFT_566729 [Dactylonectria estremocensis]|uniref:Uncharacterized protein n=1 Tax=Dactylonectria estremocensis TaxID=1079267 RepID=A0A9P9IIM5_9HYPO|nr:hypothetical protein B0J13DRAFT_566729 [Dactylonectria estremocensis]
MCHLSEYQRLEDDASSTMTTLPPITLAGIARSTFPDRWAAGCLPLLSKSTQRIQAESAAGALACTMGSFETTTAMEVFQPARLFLRYASIYWIFLLSEFHKESSRTWKFLSQSVLHSNSLIEKPWEGGPRDVGQSGMATWVLRARYYPLLHLFVT